MKIVYYFGILIPRYHDVIMCFGSMVLVLKLPNPKYEKLIGRDGQIDRR